MTIILAAKNAHGIHFCYDTWVGGLGLAVLNNEEFRIIQHTPMRKPTFGKWSTITDFAFPQTHPLLAQSE
jgi:hypothetical protein